MSTTANIETDIKGSDATASSAKGNDGGENGAVDNTKARNKEAILTAGMGYGRKKRQNLNAFWSIVWPGLEKTGWKRIIGEGNDEGSIIFLPPGVETAKWGKRNIEYFDKIKLVIKILEERRTMQEGKILDLYRDEIRTIDRDILKSRPKRGSGRPRLGLSRPSIKADTSWKDGRCLYPKRSTQVGAEYQVSSLPRAGIFEAENILGESEHELIWSCKEAAGKGMLSFIEGNVPYNKREKALQLMHENNYTLSDKKDFVQQIDRSNVSRWTEEDKEKFREEIFRSRKNFKVVCQNMGKEMGDIIAYYLGHYKKSDDYRFLKTVRSEEKAEKARQATHNVDHCAICGEGGSLLICDGCESEWHMQCAKPALKIVPEGRWECDICVDRKFLDGRKRILEDFKTNISDQIMGKRIKSKLPPKTNTGSNIPHEGETRSTNLPVHAIEAMKEFSRNIHSILSNPSVSGKLKERDSKLTVLPTNI